MLSRIHNEIENWLAADVHNQLSTEERAALERHLNDCATCRTQQQEQIQMHQLLETTLGEEKPEPDFEQRMLARFRDRVPARDSGVLAFFANLLQMRAAQITAVAALLLTLVEVGKIVTREEISTARAKSVSGFMETDSRARRDNAVERGVGTTSNIPMAEETGPQTKGGAFTDAALFAQPNELKKAPARPDEPVASSADELSLTARTEEAQAELPRSVAAPAAVDANKVERTPVPTGASGDLRKLVRNAQLDLKVIKYDAAVQSIATFANEEHGFVATQNSSKLPNGKLQGTIVVKVAPENLDRFLEKVRSLGELKNQTLGTEDVTKAYFDTDARLRNARRMEDRLLEMLQKNTGKVSDLLQVEKELARVREQIEQMQGELKYFDALVQFATVTISLAEKELDEPAAFLLKETANLALFSSDVEKTFGEVKEALRHAKIQIVQSTLDRANSGEATARMTLLIAPEESEAVIARLKGLGRVENFNLQTERIAQNGSGMSETARVERDKVQLNLVVSREQEEPSVQQTSLRILTPAVADKVERLKAAATQVNAELRSSTFSRNPDGREVANITLRVPMKNYADLVASFDQLGKVKGLSVQRNDRPGTTASAETAPAEVSVQIYSEGKIVSDQTGITATLRRTLGQGVAALMWSLRMIGVGLAFLAPWALALGLVAWLLTRIVRRRG